MDKVFIINAHYKTPFSEGRLNASLVDLAKKKLNEKGIEVRVFNTDGEWDIAQQLYNHQWADVIIIQSPIYCMTVPWTFKKYMDEVYTAGMGGSLCNGDGRHRDNPKKNYGTAGTLTGKRYMLSVTLNAPEECFEDSEEYLFQGKSLDDLLFPIHMNLRFFGMEMIPTFACYDVVKNVDIETDFQRFSTHLITNLI